MDQVGRVVRPSRGPFDAAEALSVAVTASVQKRPDIAVTNVVAPPRAPVNVPVRITAVISELNGDIGGRTDCVLYVNGVENDRANALWIDSGDSVRWSFDDAGGSRDSTASIATATPFSTDSRPAISE